MQLQLKLVSTRLPGAVPQPIGLFVFLSQHKQRSADCSFPHQLTGCYCRCVSVRAGASCTTRCRLFKFLVRIFVNEWLFQIFVPKSREVPGLLCFVHGAVPSGGRLTLPCPSLWWYRYRHHHLARVLLRLVYLQLLCLICTINRFGSGMEKLDPNLIFFSGSGIDNYTTHSHASPPNNSVCRTGKIVL